MTYAGELPPPETEDTSRRTLAKRLHRIGEQLQPKPACGCVICKSALELKGIAAALEANVTPR